MAYKVLVLKGDGIGPEVVGEALQVLKVVARRDAVDLEFKEAVIGGHAIDAHGVPLPPNTLAAAKDSDAILLGAVGGPKWDNPKADVRPEQALLGLRKELGLFANLRPVKTVKELVPASPLRPEIIAGVDMVVIRELTGGIYYGKPSERREGRDGREAVDTCTYSAQEIERVLRYGFELARDRRKKLTSVDKANVLATSRLWREIATELSAEFSDVKCEHQLVDSMAMHLIRRPRDFDVIVTENMFGDILTDEASVLAGSMGTAAVGLARRRDERRRLPDRVVRADSWQRARYRGTGRGQSAGGDTVGGDAAGTFAGDARGGRADHAGGR
jgi:3-isopropylmalate dehydrogenase